MHSEVSHRDQSTIRKGGAGGDDVILAVVIISFFAVGFGNGHILAVTTEPTWVTSQETIFNADAPRLASLNSVNSPDDVVVAVVVKSFSAVGVSNGQTIAGTHSPS